MAGGGLRFSADEVAAIQERIARSIEKARRRRTEEVVSERQEAENGPESRLQARIEADLKRRGYFYFHDRSRGDNEPGLPDLVIAMPKGRTVWMELKAKAGRMTQDQKRVRLILMYLGHEFYEVRSFRRYLEIVDGSKQGGESG